MKEKKTPAYVAAGQHLLFKLPAVRIWKILNQARSGQNGNGMKLCAMAMWKSVNMIHGALDKQECESRDCVDPWSSR